MNEFLERQRLIEEHRRISISNQDMRLKQGDIEFYFLCFLKEFKSDKISENVLLYE